MIIGQKVVVDPKEKTRFTGVIQGMGFVIGEKNEVLQQYIIKRDEPYYDPCGGWIVYTVVHPDNVSDVTDTVEVLHCPDTCDGDCTICTAGNKR